MTPPPIPPLAPSSSACVPLDIHVGPPRAAARLFAGVCIVASADLLLRAPFSVAPRLLAAAVLWVAAGLALVAAAGLGARSQVTDLRLLDPMVWRLRVGSDWQDAVLRGAAPVWHWGWWLVFEASGARREVWVSVQGTPAPAYRALCRALRAWLQTTPPARRRVDAS